MTAILAASLGSGAAWIVRGLGKTGSVFTPAQRPFKADSGLCSLLQWYVKFNAKYLTASSL